MLASEKGYTEIVKLLLEHIADITEINAQAQDNYYGYTEKNGAWATHLTSQEMGDD